MLITRAKGGELERLVDINTVEIPDLWHCVRELKADGEPHRRRWAEMILETWFLCHDFKRTILEMGLAAGEKSNER